MSSLTQEQQAIRALGIGSSEIAAVCGLSPWDSAISVWDAKRGHQKTDTHHMRRGRFLEGGMMRWYAEQTQRDVVPGTTFIHPTHSIVRATPDGIVDGTRVLEVKVPNWRTYQHWGEPGTDQIAEYYVPQVQWEMAATGLQVADVIALMDGDLVIYTVDFNVRLFEAFLVRAEKFWNEHVLTGVPPAVDGTQAYAQYLRRAFPKSLGAMHETNDPEILKWVNRYRDARDRRLAAEKEEAEAMVYVTAAIGEYDGIQGDWGRISYKNNRDSSATNWKAIAAELGATDDVVAKHTVTKPGPRVIRPKFTGEK